MANLTLQQLFGFNAYQNVDSLVINKEDFGMPISINSTAESLFVAILLNAYASCEGYLTDTNNSKVNDANNNFVNYKSKISEDIDFTYWKRQYFKDNNQSYIADTFLIQQYELYINGN